MADPQNAVQLSQNYVGRGNAANAQRAVRLREIGPRMELRLVKVEEGLNGSSVLYHDYVHMSASDVAKQTRDITAKRQLAAERRAEQERNVERKKQAKAEKREPHPAENEPEEEEDEADDQDDFEYEDAAAGAPANDTAIAQDILGSDEELFDEGDEEEEDAAQSDQEDSDLEPIPLGEVEHDAPVRRRQAPSKRRR